MDHRRGEGHPSILMARGGRAPQQVGPYGAGISREPRTPVRIFQCMPKYGSPPRQSSGLEAGFWVTVRGGVEQQPERWICSPMSWRASHPTGCSPTIGARSSEEEGRRRRPRGRKRWQEVEVRGKDMLLRKPDPKRNGRKLVAYGGGGALLIYLFDPRLGRSNPAS